MATEEIRRDTSIVLEDLNVIMGNVVNRLNDSARHLTRQPPQVNLEHLQSAIYQIKAPAVHRAPPREKNLEEWTAYLAGNTKTLDAHVIKYLCWMPEISLDVRFLLCLKESKTVLNRRCIAGLVSSCHTKWHVLPGDSPSLAIIKGLVRRYRGSDQVFVRWQAHADIILGKDGPRVLAERLIGHEVSLRAFTREWRLTPQTSFFGEIVENACALSRSKMPRITRGLMLILFRDLLSWQGWKPQAFKKEIGALILHRPMPGETRDIIQRFILHHRELGDPRLSENRIKWLQVPYQARERFLQWLNRETPFTFTDHVYRQGAGWVWQQRTSATEPLSFDKEDWE